MGLFGLLWVYGALWAWLSGWTWLTGRLRRMRLGRWTWPVGLAALVLLAWGVERVVLLVLVSFGSAGTLGLLALGAVLLFLAWRRARPAPQP